MGREDLLEPHLILAVVLAVIVIVWLDYHYWRFHRGAE